MAYLSFEEYKKLSLETSDDKKLSENLFEAFEIYAEVVVNSFTFDAIEKYNLLNDEYYAPKIKRAVAYQIDYMNDDESSSDSSLTSFTKEGEKVISSHSVTVGETSESVSYDNSAINTNGNSIENRASGGLKVSPLAVPLLAKVRALGRGIK